MRRYIFKRLAQSVFVIWAVASIVFAISRLAPGDPIQTLLRDATPEAREAARAELGLNQPISVQYVDYITGVMTGDFGASIYQREPVTELLLGVAEPTVSIGILGGILAISWGIPTGIISAVRRYKWPDYLTTLISFLGISMPAFWFAIILVLIVATSTSIPAYGYTSISEGIIPWFKTIILPAIAVSFPFGGIIMRMMRSSMLEVLNEDYMRTAHAKGLSGRTIILKHGFQNALIPVITIIGILLAILIAGIVAVEIVFGIRGLGRLLLESVTRRDYPVIQGTVVIISFIFVFMNLFIDIIYTTINPKIRYD
jgi:peptide/nickel transport system permease protein